MRPTNGGFSTSGHVVIVGASLAGLRAAEGLREAGLTGQLTLVGDEPYEPYDRPPLSKQVLMGRVAPESDPRCPRPLGLTSSGGSARRPSGWTSPANGCAWPMGTSSASTAC